MSADFQRSPLSADPVWNALWQALFLAGLSLVIPWLWTLSSSSLSELSTTVWSALDQASGKQATNLWPLAQSMLNWLARAMAVVLGLALAALLLLWWLQRRLQGFAATEASQWVPRLLGLLSWVLGLVVLGPHWLRLYDAPTQSFAPAVQSVLRGLLIVAAVSRLLRAAPLLWARR